MNRGSGAGIASRGVLALLVLLPLLLGCLVLNPHDDEDFNRPPIILSNNRASNQAFDQILQLNRAQATSLVLRVFVNDWDRDDVYGRLFIDYNPETPNADGIDVFGPIAGRGKNGGNTPQDFLVPTVSFMDGSCHRIELLASSGFRENPGAPSLDASPGNVTNQRLPIREGDVTQVIWWLQVTSDSTTPVAMSTCPR
jgi:hypothetical protein